MIDLQVYHSSALSALTIQRWEELESFTSNELNLSITPDGHLLQIVQPNGPFIPQLKSVIKSNEYAWAGLPFSHAYNGKVYFGNILRVEHQLAGNIVHPDAAGNRSDQDPAFTTLTFCGKHSAVQGLSSIWSAYFEKLPVDAKSQLLNSKDKNAVQARLFHSEFTLESSLDLTVASLLYACQHKHTAIYSGRSLTTVEGAPMRRTTKLIEDEFGPWERKTVNGALA